MIGVHICMGEIQNVALFGQADGCEKEKNLPPCHRHETIPCCDDETMIHEGEDFNAAAKVDISPLQFAFIELPSVLLSEVIPTSPLSQSDSFSYDPPLRACNRVVALQSFLI